MPRQRRGIRGDVGIAPYVPSAESVCVSHRADRVVRPYALSAGHTPQHTKKNRPPAVLFRLSHSLSSLRTAMNASVGTCTVPRLRIFFLPSFCFSSSFFFRVMSPP